MLTKEMDGLIRERVHSYYWNDDINCAETTLKVLSEIFDLPLNPQVIHAASGMHGAGKYGVQCGLVEGTLMFIGILGNQAGMGVSEIERLCHDYALSFEEVFGSLSCRVLRPEGFKPTNPPHLCEDLTCRSISFSVQFLAHLKGMI
ncbi:MAG TPA: C-GCAxxG-C-C family protein [Synergistales bacterium]|nr:C-GCAxxG-C-C family protein [Synergistales bacterium]